MFITLCRLVLHDYLFYASREMGRLYETEKYLHNYGLTYALGLATSTYSNVVQVPHYAEDLEALNAAGIYVTPAHPVQYTFAFHTFKMANANYYNFTPQISTNQVVFGRAKELAPESTFVFCVLSNAEVVLPRWIRLGKWMAKARVDVVAQRPAQVKKGGEASTHMSGALNPLDLPQRPEHCNIVAMAPASLVTHVHVVGDYYEYAEARAMHDEPVRLPVGMQYRPVRFKTT